MDLHGSPAPQTGWSAEWGDVAAILVYLVIFDPGKVSLEHPRAPPRANPESITWYLRSVRPWPETRLARACTAKATMPPSKLGGVLVLAINQDGCGTMVNLVRL